MSSLSEAKLSSSGIFTTSAGLPCNEATTLIYGSSSRVSYYEVLATLPVLCNVTAERRFAVLKMERLLRSTFVLCIAWIFARASCFV